MHFSEKERKEKGFFNEEFNSSSSSFSGSRSIEEEKYDSFGLISAE